MKRIHLNLLVDALAFAAFLVLTSTGVLLQFLLPAGSGGLTGHGRGGGEGQRVVATLWGWTRHDWGEFHFWVACAMLAILVVHLVLHWKWIVCVVSGKSTDRSGLRLGLGAFALVALLLLSLAPLMSPVVRQSRTELREAANPSTPNASQERSPQDER